MLNSYISKFLAVACLTLLLALSGVGWLYKTSLEGNGRLEETITTLKSELKTCRDDGLNAIADKDDLEKSLNDLQTKYEAIDTKFGTIQDQLKNKQCRGVKNEKPVDIVVADDIADTLRLLREASCLSNKDCERP